MESVYRSFYTKSDPIVGYMVSQLDVRPGNHVLEPCAGDGVFVDAVLHSTPDVSVDLYELNPSAVHTLHAKYSDERRVTINHSDTLTDAQLTLKGGLGQGYDRIIGNPPYGGWQDYEKRGFLKKRFPDMYVKETYSLFLSRCADLLSTNGILVFIVPDTFLNLHLHKPLRKRLLTRCHISEIAIFPSSFFPGVRYGYSKMCIITLKRTKELGGGLGQSIRVLADLKTPQSLLNAVRDQRRVFSFKQQVMFDNVDHALFVSDNPRVDDLINTCDTRIGDVADCVTGLYTGDDRQFVRPVHRWMRRARRYQSVDSAQICRHYLERPDLLGGLEGDQHFIPIVKGGRKRYFKPDQWYVDWSVRAVQAYKTDPRARFQNSAYYFRRGIGVPMVSSSSISAAILEDRVFDQGIVGIFPHDWTFAISG